MRVYPNPVQDALFLTTYSEQTELASLQIYDVLGRIVYKQEQGLQLGDNYVEMNVSAWKNEAKQLMLQFTSPTQGVKQIKLLR
ncbi:MAG: T9SS type A sorting domain-containing protein [Cyclobacteriaceae bacterium]